METKRLPIIGSIEYIGIAGEKNKIPAKTDTGADSSSIWASDFQIESDGSLSFVLFSKKSDLYSGVRHHTKNYSASHVRSSNGQVQVRYRVNLEITVCGQTFITTFTLNDRSRSLFPVLIGRHAVENRFLVDVSRTAFERPTKEERKSTKLTEELRKDPHAFHRKYAPSTKAVNQGVE